MLFNFNWFILILLYTFLIGLIFSITNTLPTILRVYTLKIYNFNWVSIILHSLSGLYGFIAFLIYFIEYPPEYVVNGEPVFILKGWWSISAFKTILLTFPTFGLIISFIWSTVISPIILKYEENL